MIDKAHDVTAGIGNIRDSVTSIKQGDVAGGLGGVAKSLKDIVGDNAASDVLKNISTAADPLQKQFSTLKGDIKSTVGDFKDLAGNSGRIAAGLTAISEAAGPLAAALLSVDEIDRLSGKLNDQAGATIAPRGGIVGSPMWLWNQGNKALDQGSWDPLNPFKVKPTGPPPKPTAPYTPAPGLPGLLMPGEMAPSGPSVGGIPIPGVTAAPGSKRGGNRMHPTDWTPGAGGGGSSYGIPAGANVYTGPHIEDTHGALVPRAAALKDLITQKFGVTDIGGYRNPDGYNEHSSGEALDIMVGKNHELGAQINAYLQQNAGGLGLQYDLWDQQEWDPGRGPTPMADRGSFTENHRDHVHARVRPGALTPGAGGSISAAGYSTPGTGSGGGYPGLRGGPSLGIPGGPIDGSNSYSPVQQQQTGSGKGFGLTGGGLIGMAEKAGSMGAMLGGMGGGGVAMQIGEQEMNLAIQQGGKALATLASAPMETFGLKGGQMGAPSVGSGGWMHKLVGGMVGQMTNASNVAGATQPPKQGGDKEDPGNGGSSGKGGQGGGKAGPTGHKDDPIHVQQAPGPAPMGAMTNGANAVGAMSAQPA